MTPFQATDDVGTIVLSAPATLHVFARHGIDPREGAHVSLDQACRSRGLEVSALIAELEAVRAAHGAGAEGPSGASLGALVEHVVARHHAFARREMPRLAALLARAVEAHGEEHPNLFPPLAALWERFTSAFEAHLRQEEEILFPAVRAAAEAGRPGLRCGNLDAPVLRAEWIHDEQATELDRMRRIGGGYVPPAGASPLWREVYAGLDAFERDVREHMHLENDVLFPRVRALGLRRAP